MTTVWVVVVCVSLALAMVLMFGWRVEVVRGNAVDAMAEMYGLERRKDETDPQLTQRILDRVQAEHDESE